MSEWEESEWDESEYGESERMRETTDGPEGKFLGFFIFNV